MSWVDIPDPRFVMLQHLVRDDDNSCIATIMRFYEDMPTYVWTLNGRIGPVGHRNADGSYDPVKSDEKARQVAELDLAKPRVVCSDHEQPSPPQEG
jgi:hypothetical protein